MSKDGLARCGAAADRIRVVPHGFDPAFFHPLADDGRTALRRGMGLEGRFVFLSVGAMTQSKGMKTLLQVFAVIAAKYPEAVLMLKGTDQLYPSEKMLSNTIAQNGLTHLADRIFYKGDSLSMADMGKLYNVADAYVAPYAAEGFCIPVLEAAACGRACIVTDGGPTDDFTAPSFAWRIESRPVEKRIESSGLVEKELRPNPDHLAHLMEKAILDRAFRDSARRAGHAYVAERFTWEKVVDRLLAAFKQP